MQVDLPIYSIHNMSRFGFQRPAQGLQENDQPELQTDGEHIDSLRLSLNVIHFATKNVRQMNAVLLKFVMES
jgi:hypothetical protein